MVYGNGNSLAPIHSPYKPAEGALRLNCACPNQADETLCGIEMSNAIIDVGASGPGTAALVTVAHP